MNDKLVFTVEESRTQEATRVTLPEVRLKERSDLQEWVLGHPSLLGGDAAIVTTWCCPTISVLPLSTAHVKLANAPKLGITVI